MKALFSRVARFLFSSPSGVHAVRTFVKSGKRRDAFVIDGKTFTITYVGKA